MDKVLQELIVNLKNSPFVIGFGGAIAGVLTSGKLSIKKRIIFTVIGGIFAGYGAPFLHYLFGVEDQAVSNFIAFVVGMLGMSLTGGLMKLGDSIRKDPESFIKRWRGWKNKD